MYNIAVAGAEGGDERVADTTAGNLLSGSGLLEVSPGMVDVVSWAIRTGYLTALHDVRDGRIDNL